MTKKLFPPIVASIILIVLATLGACSTDELMPDAKPNTSNPQGRTLSLTAAMPSKTSTRVGLTQEADKSITLTWQAGDELQLAFVQGATKATNIATIASMTADKRKATFQIEIPAEIDLAAVFNLYGVYGAGTIDITGTNPIVTLPTNPYDATSLADVQNRKDVMLSFQTLAVDVNGEPISVVFSHLGSLFCITVKNTSTQSLKSITGVSLDGINNPDNQKWAYNSGASGQTYDLVNNEFLNPVSASNFIAFTPAKNSIPVNETVTFWGWYPPLPGVHWPELEIGLSVSSGGSPALLAGRNTLPARTSETAAGKSYYFYAAWDGAELNFTNESFTNQLTIDVAEMGTLNTLLSATQKANTTKLTLTGKINEVDYEVMKSQMPSLKHVDLSQVTSYQGETVNKVPDFAFGDVDMQNEENPFGDANQTIETVILPQSTTVIGANAFSGCMGITSPLIIPDNVTKIEDMAFAGSGFNGPLTIPNKVTTIGNMAFAGSGFTGSLTIPNRVATIGDQAFALSNFSSLTFQDASQLTTIGNGAFQFCNNLTGELILPANLLIIGDDAFSGCKFSGPLSIPAKVTKIGDSAFYGSKFTGSLIIPKEVITIADNAFQLCGFTGSLSFQDGSKLEAIGRLSFYDCGFTGTLSLPSNLQTIGDKAFQSCEGFTSNIVFPSTLTSIGESSFVSCNLVDAFQFMSVTPIKYTDLMLAEGKLVKVPSTVAAEKYKATSGWTPRHTIEGLFDGHAVHVATKGTLSTILSDHQYPLADITNLKLTGQINKADYEVMKKEMPNLKVVDLGQVTSYEGEIANKIPNSAFGDWNSDLANKTITTIIFPESVTHIGKYAFDDCSGLTGNLALPAWLISIEKYAFENCTGLTGSLTIPKGVTTIEERAFYMCIGLDGNLTLSDDLITIGQSAFNTCRKLVGNLIIPHKVTTIEAYAFTNCTHISGTIDLPISLTSIGTEGFDQCIRIEAYQFNNPTPIAYTENMLNTGKPVKVPVGQVDAYKAKWDNNTDRHTITEF